MGGNLVRIGVLSDTHGNLAKARLAIKQMGEVDAIIHAGDHYMDATSLNIETGIKMHAVVGNNDYHKEGPSELEVKINDFKFYILHGHQFGYARTRSQKLYYAGFEKSAQVVIYGHTHVPHLEWVNGILLFNPGSVYRPRSDYGPSFGVLEIESNSIKPKIYQLKI
jgi:uncharacterized protein